MITPQEPYIELAKALQIDSLVFKREDLHLYGSHKGRSIPIMIDIYSNQGISHFAISSSGNAALAAAQHIHKLNQENQKSNKEKKISLDILIGQHISKKKLNILETFRNENINVTMHDRPLQTLFQKTKDPSIKALRQSTDPSALIGYSTLADELLEIADLQAVFIGTSSGTTAQALAENFISKERKVEVHIVQTSSCHPIANAFVDSDVIDERSIADAIVDHIAKRKDTLIKLIEKTGGSAWIASNEQILAAQDITKKHTDISISTNSALSVAGLMQAVYTGKSWDGTVVCIICGD